MKNHSEISWKIGVVIDELRAYVIDNEKIIED